MQYCKETTLPHLQLQLRNQQYGLFGGIEIYEAHSIKKVNLEGIPFMDVILDILGSAFLDNAKYFAENLLIICQFFLINRYFAYYFLLLLEFED